MNTTEKGIPMLYIGEHEKIDATTLYFIEFVKITEKGELDVNIYDGITSTLIFENYHYDTMEKFLRSWVISSKKSTRMISIFDHNYSKDELMDAISCLKTISEFYSNNFRWNSIIGRRVHKSFRLIRNCIIEKIK